MSIFTSLENSFYTALVNSYAVLGKTPTVMFANQNGPEPVGDYITISVLDMTRQGYASKSGLAEFATNQAKEYAVQSYDSLVQLNFYGEGAGDLASLISSQWRSNTECREHFLRNDLAPRWTGNVRRAPQLRDAYWVNAFALDVRVGYAVRTIQDVDWADYITVNGNTIPLNK